MHRTRFSVLVGVVAHLALGSLAACGDDGGLDPIYSGNTRTGGSGTSYCRALDEYYDGCCFTCGPTDTYCTDSEYDVRGASEPWCEGQLENIDTRYCYCDIFKGVDAE